MKYKIQALRQNSIFHENYYYLTVIPSISGHFFEEKVTGQA